MKKIQTDTWASFVIKYQIIATDLDYPNSCKGIAYRRKLTATQNTFYAATTLHPLKTVSILATESTYVKLKIKSAN